MESVVTCPRLDGLCFKRVHITLKILHNVHLHGENIRLRMIVLNFFNHFACPTSITRLILPQHDPYRDCDDYLILWPIRFKYRLNWTCIRTLHMHDTGIFLSKEGVIKTFISLVEAFVAHSTWKGILFFLN